MNDDDERGEKYPPPIDRVDAALDVACSVLADYGSDSSGSTRIERLARWAVANLDPCPTMQQVGTVTKYHCARPSSPEDRRRAIVVWRVGDMICLDIDDDARSGELSAADARQIATALFRAAELVED